MMKHATWNNHAARPSYSALELKFCRFLSKASYATAYVPLLRSLRATEDVPRSLSGVPGSFFAVHCATAAKGFACWLVSFWFLVSGFELQAFVTFASFAAKNPTQSLTHSFRPVTDILRHPPMSKIMLQESLSLKQGK